MTVSTGPRRPKRSAGGRPPKFAVPSRRVTVTLPERTLEELAAVDSDRAKAIVKVVEESPAASSRPVTLVEVGPDVAVLVTAHSEYLETIPWLRLVEIAPARHLLSFASGTPIEALEVALGDLLEGLPEEEKREREVLEQLRDRLSQSRRDLRLTKAEFLVVATHP